MTRAVGRLLADVLAVALIALAVVMLSGRVAVQPVLSGSMSGFAERGDLLVGMQAQGPLRVGDVILFAPPSPYETPGNRPVAHRIRGLTTVDGVPVATTQGDANPQPDPWTLDLSRTRTAEVRLVVPEAGWPFLRLQLLATPVGRIGTGLAMMAAGGLMLLVGRPRPRRSDEPWPPPFEKSDESPDRAEAVVSPLEEVDDGVPAGGTAEPREDAAVGAAVAEPVVPPSPAAHRPAAHRPATVALTGSLGCLLVGDAVRADRRRVPAPLRADHRAQVAEQALRLRALLREGEARVREAAEVARALADLSRRH